MHDPDIEALARARWKVAAGLSAAMVLMYFGFLALVAWGREFLARPLVPGLTLGIALGASVIVASWLLTWAYIRWCARHHDSAVDRLGGT